jgi:hypothetical protein
LIYASIVTLVSLAVTLFIIHHKTNKANNANKDIMPAQKVAIIQVPQIREYKSHKQWNIRHVHKLRLTPDSVIVDKDTADAFAKYQAHMMLFLNYTPDGATCDLTPFRSMSNSHGAPIDEETLDIAEDLVQLNAHGFVTTNSQPGKIFTSSQGSQVKQHNFVVGFVLVRDLGRVLAQLDESKMYYRVFYLSPNNKTPTTPDSIATSASSEFIFDACTHDANDSSPSVFEHPVQLAYDDDDDDDDDVILSFGPTNDKHDIMEAFKMEMGIGYTYMKGRMHHMLLRHIAYVEIVDKNSYENTLPQIIMRGLPSDKATAERARQHATRLCSEQPMIYEK